MLLITSSDSGTWASEVKDAAHLRLRIAEEMFGTPDTSLDDRSRFEVESVAEQLEDGEEVRFEDGGFTLYRDGGVHGDAALREALEGIAGRVLQTREDCRLVAEAALRK